MLVGTCSAFVALRKTEEIVTVLSEMKVSAGVKVLAPRGLEPTMTLFHYRMRSVSTVQ